MKYFGTNFGTLFSALSDVVPAPGLFGDPIEGATEAWAEEEDETPVEDPNRFPIMEVAVVTRLEVLFLEESSVENTWIVP